ncbi:MAG: hypothetical protein JXR05_16645 [Flavobacteriaceae bacterium]
MSTNKQNKEEEVDLGSLFIIIGNGFKKFFNFIWMILTGIFHFLILILLFIKENIIKLLIAAAIGGGIGAYKEFTKEATFGSDLIVQPNFKSTKQLYDNINYYNDLVSQKEIGSLVETFGIDSVQARNIKKFEITPIISENDVLESYDELVLSIDTLTIQSYSFAQFKKAFTDYDYKEHKIHVESKDNNVFSKLDDVIISSIVKNEFFDKLKKNTRENLYRTDSLLRENLTHLDSLRQVYMKVMLVEAKKSSAGTSIDLGGTKTTTKELELFQTNRIINKDLKDISEDISEKSEIINVISNFQSIGYEIKGLGKNFIVIYGGLGLVLMIVFILFRSLNSYLESYKKK